MNKNFFAEILTRKPELMASMLRFNSPHQSSSMPDSLKNLAKQGIDTKQLWNDSLLSQKYFEKCLGKSSQRKNSKSQNKEEATKEGKDSENKSDVLGTEQIFCWDFAEESKRLALIDQNTLGQLIIYLGTALNAEEITHCIEKAKVLSIKKIIGDEAYTYALGRGNFQFGNKKIIMDALPFFATEGSFSKRILMQGVFTLYICTKDWTENSRKIIYNKMLSIIQENITEKAISDKNINLEEFKASLQQFTFADISETTKRHVWFSLKKMITKELAPSWALYFD